MDLLFVFIVIPILLCGVFAAIGISLALTLTSTMKNDGFKKVTRVILSACAIVLSICIVWRGFPDRMGSVLSAVFICGMIAGVAISLVFALTSAMKNDDLKKMYRIIWSVCVIVILIYMLWQGYFDHMGSILYITMRVIL